MRLVLGNDETVAALAGDPAQAAGVAALSVRGNFIFDAATHRDFLGALLGTGIDRQKARPARRARRASAFVSQSTHDKHQQLSCMLQLSAGAYTRLACEYTPTTVCTSLLSVGHVREPQPASRCANCRCCTHAEVAPRPTRAARWATCWCRARRAPRSSWSRSSSTTWSSR